MKLYDQRDKQEKPYIIKIRSPLLAYYLRNVNRYKRIKTLYTYIDTITQVLSEKHYRARHVSLVLTRYAIISGECDILAVVRPFFSSLSLPRRSGGMHDNTRHRTW
jgi:hypothetical protein